MSDNIMKAGIEFTAEVRSLDKVQKVKERLVEAAEAAKKAQEAFEGVASGKSFETAINRYASALKHLDDRIDDTTKKVAKLKNFNQELSPGKAFSEDVNKALEAYPRGFAAARQSASRFYNTDLAGQQMTLSAWQDKGRELERHMALMEQAHKEGRVLNQAEIKGLHEAAAHAQEFYRVYTRNADRRVTQEGQLLHLTNQRQAAEERLSRARAESDAQAKISGQSLLGFELSAMNKQLQQRLRFNGQRTKSDAAVAKAEDIARRERIDAIKDELQAEYKAGEDRTKFRLRVGRKFAAIQEAEAREQKALAERAEADRRAAVAKSEKWLEGVLKKGAKLNESNHRDWIAALGRRSDAMKHGWKQEDARKAAAQKSVADSKKAWIDYLQDRTAAMKWGWKREDARKARTAALMARHKKEWISGLRQRMDGIKNGWRLDDETEKRQARAYRVRAKQAEELEKSHLRVRNAMRSEAWGGVKDAMNTPMRMANRADQNGYFSSPAFVATAGIAAAAAGARAAIRDAVSVDSAMEAAQVNIGIKDKDTGKERAMNSAERADFQKKATEEGLHLGVDPATMIRSAVDANKAGVPAQFSLQAAEMGVKLSKVLDLSVGQTIEDLGKGASQLYGRNPNASLDDLNKQVNVAGRLAAESPATGSQIMSFYRTGPALGALHGLSFEQSMAYGTAAISAGAQAQQAATMMGHQFDLLAELPMRLREVRKKHHKTAQDRLLLSGAPEALGYGDNDAMLEKFKQDPGEIFSFITRLGKIEDPMKRAQVATAYFGHEFGRFLAGMAASPGVMEKALETAKDESQKAAGKRFSDTAWEEHLKGWQHMLDVMDASWKALKATIGDGFKPFVKDFEEYFVDITKGLRDSGVADYIGNFLTGAIKGFGYSGLKPMLNDIFGGNTFDIRKDIMAGDLGEGLGAGIKSAWSTVKSVLEGVFVVLKPIASLLGFDTSTAKGIGELLGSIVGFSLAIRVIRPLFAVIGLLKDGFLGLWAVMRAGNAILAATTGLSAAGWAGKGLGAMGAMGWAGRAANAGIAAGGLLGAAANFGGPMSLAKLFPGSMWMTAGGLIGVAFLAKIAERFNTLQAPDTSRGWGRAAVEFLDPGLASRLFGAGPGEAGAPESQVPGTIPRRASGGFVYGAGGPRTDSILARLSNGEFVVNAASAARHRGLLEAINGGTIPGFADGGSIGGGSGTGRGYMFGGSALDSIRSSDLRDLTYALKELARNTRLLLEDQARRQRKPLDAWGGVDYTGPGTAPAGSPQGPDAGAGYGPSGFPRAPGMNVPEGYGGANRSGAGGNQGIYGRRGNPANRAAPTGDRAQRMKGVYEAFKSAGFSHDAAKSFAAEIGRENDYNPNLLYGTHRDPHNGKTNAGMMSWQGDRATKLLDFLRSKGQLNADGSIKRTQESLNAQAEFAKKEMTDGTLRNGRRALAILNDPNSTHAQRALTLGDDVIKWRQHDPRYASHANRRDRYYGELGGITEGGAGAGPQTPEAGNVAQRIAQLRSSGAITGRECVDLVKAWTGTTNMTTRSWRKGDNASAGTLKAGDSVATFIGPDGRPSSQYAGGTGGTRGANRDHAAIFQEYINGPDGKPIGMRVMEQYRRTGGRQVQKDYMFGQGTGEGNGSNYHKVLGPDGNPLGGRGPAAASVAAQTSATQAAAAAAGAAPGNVEGNVSLRRSWVKPDGQGWREEGTGRLPNPDEAAGLAQNEVRMAQAKMRLVGRSEQRQNELEDLRDAANAAAVRAVSARARPTAEDLAGAAAPGAASGLGRRSDLGGGNGTTIHAPVTINGAQMSSGEIAGSLQRHVSEARGFRTHDYEPELS